MFDLAEQIDATALAFRGYNVTNLGRTAEFLDHPSYSVTMVHYLNEAARICGDVSGRKVDLVARVRLGQETTLETYDEAIALLVGVEMAQLTLLLERYGIDYRRAPLAYGYSLGELVALAAGGAITMEEALRIPLSMAAEAAVLAADVTMGVLFSRHEALDLERVRRLCLAINVEGQGVLGISSILSPNTVLLLGQQDTIDRFTARIKTDLGRDVHLRRNPDRWPPMHTSLVWQRNIPNRVGVMLHTVAGGFTAPAPKVLSLTTGTFYNDTNCRDLVYQWIDHPQQLWEAVMETLSEDIDVVLHIGPAPNLIPATFERLARDVSGQLKERSLSGIGRRAVGGIVSRPWLRALLPERAALLRAPQLVQVNLEDWLLDKLKSK
jgi:[acyl-carrier-protein] S-malonyltransferase